MKIRLLFFIAILISPYLSIGQSFNSGLAFGLVASQVDGDNFGGYNKIGLYGGIFVGHPINDKFDLNMQISFIQKGSRQNASPADGVYTSYLMRLNYAEIPLYFNWKLYQKKLYFQGGLTFGYLINAIEKDEYGVITQSSSVPEFNRFELGILGGFGYNINDKWSFVLRGQYSILPVRNTPLIVLWYFNESLRNNVITTALYYHF